MQPDAFTPPSAEEEEEEEDGAPAQDLLYTSPLRLLQAVDLELARLRDGTSALKDVPLLPGGPSQPYLGKSLRELREDILPYCGF